MTADWYTVGVLLDSNGALPFTHRDTPKPVYRPGTFHSPSARALRGAP